MSNPNEVPLTTIINRRGIDTSEVNEKPSQETPGLDLDALNATPDRNRILIIDDDVDMVTLLKLTLRNAGMDVAGAHNSDEAVQKCSKFQPDLILLDLMMPMVDGFETLRRLRQITTAPVVIVSAKHTKPDVVKGLDIGADDYVTKPIYPPEIVSRIQAVLRRTGVSEPITKCLFPKSGLRIHFDTQEVFLKDEPVVLSPIAFRALAVLAKHAPDPVSYTDLAVEVWGEDNSKIRNRIKWIIHQLRKKLEHDPSNPEIILNRSGFGYQLADDMNGEIDS
jgi:two-component system KDP operon response regulator KdpE